MHACIHESLLQRHSMRHDDSFMILCVCVCVLMYTLYALMRLPWAPFCTHAHLQGSKRHYTHTQVTRASSSLSHDSCARAIFFKPFCTSRVQKEYTYTHTSDTRQPQPSCIHENYASLSLSLSQRETLDTTCVQSLARLSWFLHSRIWLGLPWACTHAHLSHTHTSDFCIF